MTSMTDSLHNSFSHSLPNMIISEKSQPNHQVSQHTIELVKSTVPLLKQYGQQITTRMYEIMFLNYPEIKAQFDSSAQANGSQTAKLANAVSSYAAHIDNLEKLTSMVEKIAHRHLQSQVLPEQYPIVGESLLQAIKDVLGDAATEEIMAAWTDAYRVLADVFIHKEQQLSGSKELY